MSWLWVALGGAVGAPSRYVVDQAVRAWRGGELPWGTFVVNALGSLLLGALTGLVGEGAASGSTQAFLGAGLFGAFTTYSTFSFETLALWEGGRWRWAALNVLGTVVVCLTLFGVGLALARFLARVW